MTLILILALLTGFCIGYWTHKAANKPIFISEDDPFIYESKCWLNTKKNVHMSPKQNGYVQFQSYNN